MTEKPRLRVTQDGRVRISDGFVNVAAGLGTSRDKAFGASYSYVPLDQYEVLTAYRMSWLARKIVDVIPADATRNWRQWHAEETQVSDLEKAEKALAIQRKVKQAHIIARLLGGAALYYSVKNQDAEQPLELDKVRKDDLTAVTLLTRNHLIVSEMQDDEDLPGFNEPKYYAFNTKSQGTIKIHPSRVAVFRGLETPQGGLDWTWGDSVLLAMLQTIKHNDSFQANAASMVYEANVDVLTIPRLMEMMAEDGGDEKVIMYLQTVARVKGNNGMLILDGGDTSVPENASGGTKYERKPMTFTGLSDLWDRMNRSAAGGADVPMTRLWGVSPGGLNATGESDANNYAQHISAEQKNYIAPNISNLDEVLIRSALGTRPPELYYDWRSIYEETPEEKINRGKSTSAIIKELNDTGLFPEDTMQGIAVAAMTETGALPGFEAAIEEHGLEIEETDEEKMAAALGAQALKAAQRPQAGQPAGRTTPTGTRLQAVADARPATLYIRRDVLNAEDILEHYRQQGYLDLEAEDELHVTQIYSETPLDWMAVPETWTDHIDLPAGGPRIQESFGSNGEAQVLLIGAREMKWRFREILEAGATSKYAEFSPHITLSYSEDMSDADPWIGEILLGPEIWEEVKKDPPPVRLTDADTVRFQDKVNQPRHPKGTSTGGQFAPKNGAGSAAAGGGVNKDAVANAYYQLKKAGGNSWMTQKGLMDLVEGKAEADTPQKKLALTLAKAWNKESPEKIKAEQATLKAEFKKQLEETKAKTQAKVASLKTEVAALAPEPVKVPATPEQKAELLQEIGMGTKKYKVSGKFLQQMIDGEKPTPEYHKAKVELAKQKLAELDGDAPAAKPAPAPAPAGLTAQQEDQKDAVLTTLKKTGNGATYLSKEGIEAGQYILGNDQAANLHAQAKMIEKKIAAGEDFDVVITNAKGQPVSKLKPGQSKKDAVPMTAEEKAAWSKDFKVEKEAALAAANDKVKAAQNTPEHKALEANLAKATAEAAKVKAQGETLSKNAQLAYDSQSLNMVAKAANGMQPETLKKLASGEWSPDPNKPWQKKAVEQYVTAQQEIAEGKKPAILKAAENAYKPATPIGAVNASAALTPGGGLTKQAVVHNNLTGELAEKYKSQTTTTTSPGTSQKALVNAAAPTAESIAAVRTYTGNAYTSINQRLRDGGAPTAADKKRDAYISNYQLKDDHVFLRGVNSNAVKLLIDKAGGELKPGAIITDNGYASLTRSRGTAQSFAGYSYESGYIMKITAKKGATVAPVDSISKNSGEDEFLLPRGSKTRVVSIDPVTRVMELELI